MEQSKDPIIEDAYQQAVRAFGHLPYVTGIDIGPEYVEGRQSGRRAIRVHVAVKRPKAELTPAEIFPDTIGNVPIDVLERSYFPAVEAQAGLRAVMATAGAQRFDKLRPGISVSHKLCPSGTLGMFVQDDDDGQLALLTNWHVLSDSSFARPGDPVTQPSAMDGGRQPRDIVARIRRSLLDADGDAAIAGVTNDRRVDLAIRGVDLVPDAVVDPEDRDVVVKCGRSTDVTVGRVEGRGVYFPIYRTRDRIGINGFEIVPLDRRNPKNIELSTNGDSGSVWLKKDSTSVVGLHFAGERDAAPEKEVALACFATRVFRRLRISLPT